MDKLFLEILNTAITAGWLVLAVLLARLLLKKAPAWTKCALWAIVAVRLVWPFSIESVLSLLPSAETIPSSQLYVPAPQVHTGISSLNAAINPVFTETFRTEPINSVNPLQVASWIAGWVWVLGMIVMAVYAAVSYLRLRRLVRVSMPAGEGVYLCDMIPSPFILGIIKPRIYLPADLSREKWDSILSHERAHLARRDHWWKPLGFLLLSVFWFHPLLWLAYVLLCRDVELACDEKVIQSLTDQQKREYSQVLLECSVPRKWICACPLAFGEIGVKQRIRAVLHYKKPTLWILIVALVLCTVLAVCFLTEPSDGADDQLMDISGKQYVYNGEGAGSSFYINIYEDGTFQYYAGVYSSHIGLGDWEVKDGKLYLYDTTLQYPMTFVFSLAENALVYISDGSHPFNYVDVKNGDLFLYYADIPLKEVGQDVPGPAEEWHWIYQVIGLETGTFQLDAFPEYAFRWGDGKIQFVHNGKFTSLVENATIYHLGAADFNLDGYPELCATVNTEDKGEHVIIYDIANKETYTMYDPDGAYVYSLYTKNEDGNRYVMCAKYDTKTEKAVEAGRLFFAHGENGSVPAIRKPTLHSQSSDTLTVLFDRDHPDSAHQGEVEMEGFQGVSVRWCFTPNAFLGAERPVLVKDGKETVLFEDFPSPTSLYLADVTGDGKQDLCANIYYFFSGLPSFNAACVYDYANDRYYLLADDLNANHYTKCSYYLRPENGKLVCDKVAEKDDSVLATGPLYLDGSVLCMRPLRTYVPPVQYAYVGENNWDRVLLTVIHGGTCKMYFSPKPLGGVTGSWLFGDYVKTDGRLYFYTENCETYVFRFEGDDLVFEAEKSSPLPENCILYDGAILKANVRQYE